MTTVCVVCFNFHESKIRLQPWRYIYEIFSRLSQEGIKVHIITDGYPDSSHYEELSGIQIHRLRSINKKLFFENQDLINLIEKINPELVFWTLGSTSLLSLRTIHKIDKEIIGLWLGTTYTFPEMMQIGFSEIYRNFSSVHPHLISSIIPHILIRRIFKIPRLQRIIVQNSSNKKRLAELGCSECSITVIPPGLDKGDLTIPNANDISRISSTFNIEKDKFYVLYFGSPLSIRGTDILIEAVSDVRYSIPEIQVFFLSRRRSEELLPEERYLENLITELNLEKHVRIISGFLNPEDVKTFIAISDIVVLPFKFVQADTPISILEAMALKKVVVSTMVDGIPDLLSDGRGILIKPNNVKALAEAITEVYQNPRRREQTEIQARNYCANHMDWEETTGIFNKTVEDVLKRN